MVSQKSYSSVLGCEGHFFRKQIFLDVAMAGILQNVFSKGIYTLKDPENVSKLKTVVNHSALYFGLIVYTAIGAKVSVRQFDKCHKPNICMLTNVYDLVKTLILALFDL